MSAQEITVALSPAIMPFGYGKGHPTNKILTDGTRFYCAGDVEAGTPCPDQYSGPSFGSVMAHLSGQHGRRKARNAELKASGTSVEQALADIKARAQALVQDVDSIEARLGHPDGTEDRVSADWKRRALRAERALKSIRRAVSG